MSKFLTTVDLTKDIYLDVGSGHNPTPNCIHLDVRENLPHLDVVCDFSKEPLPFPDNSISGIISNHSIEHVKWTEVSFLVKEWCRVLKPGRSAQIRTPDLRFIAKKYLNGLQTKEWPEDEARAAQIFGQCGPSEIALIKLYAGQDYESNVHYACYDFEMMQGLLKRCGFTVVSNKPFGPERSPGELQITATKGFSIVDNSVDSVKI